jgi:SAM-dependent methyltransferase
VPFKGSPARIRAVWHALASELGYRAFRDEHASLLTRAPGAGAPAPPPVELSAVRGAGRYLDVGCGSGAALGIARELGWQVPGIDTPVRDRSWSRMAGLSEGGRFTAC